MSDHAGKYARLELERRFLVDKPPASVSRRDGWLIVDRYITGTELRLRRMEPFGVGETLYEPVGRLKLAQKKTLAPPDYSRMTITNIYLRLPSTTCWRSCQRMSYESGATGSRRRDAPTPSISSRST